MTHTNFSAKKAIPYTLNTVEEFDAFIAQAEASPVMTFEEGERYLADNLKSLIGKRKHTTHSL